MIISVVCVFTRFIPGFIRLAGKSLISNVEFNNSPYFAIMKKKHNTCNEPKAFAGVKDTKVPSGRCCGAAAPSTIAASDVYEPSRKVERNIITIARNGKAEETTCFAVSDAGSIAFFSSREALACLEMLTQNATHYSVQCDGASFFFDEKEARDAFLNSLKNSDGRRQNAK